MSDCSIICGEENTQVHGQSGLVSDYSVLCVTGFQQGHVCDCSIVCETLVQDK